MTGRETRMQDRYGVDMLNRHLGDQLGSVVGAMRTNKKKKGKKREFLIEIGKKILSVAWGDLQSPWANSTMVYSQVSEKKIIWAFSGIFL